MWPLLVTVQLKTSTVGGHGWVFGWSWIRCWIKTNQVDCERKVISDLWGEVISDLWGEVISDLWGEVISDLWGEVISDLWGLHDVISILTFFMPVMLRPLKTPLFPSQPWPPPVPPLSRPPRTSTTLTPPDLHYPDLYYPDPPWSLLPWPSLPCTPQDLHYPDPPWPLLPRPPQDLHYWATILLRWPVVIKNSWKGFCVSWPQTKVPWTSKRTPWFWFWVLPASYWTRKHQLRFSQHNPIMSPPLANKGFPVRSQLLYCRTTNAAPSRWFWFS